MSGLVLREDRDAVAILTINRPDKLNALSPELFLELRDHVDAIASDAERIRVVVFKGAGRSFCAGADLDAIRAGVVTENPEFRSETVERIGEMPQVTIAAVHGHCYTGGLELALAADLIVAASDAKFCDTHAKVGIIPRWGMSARLPRRVGLSMAKRLSLTGDSLGPEEALRVGLCDYVVAREQLDNFSLELAERIARQAPVSLSAIKHLYEHAVTLSTAEALTYERAFSKTPAKKDG